MRWESLFGDLEASFAAEEAAGLASEIDEAVRAERSSLRLADRFRASRGEQVRLLLLGGLRLTLRLGVVGRDWISGTWGHHEVLVPLAAVQSAGGLARLGEQERSESRIRLGLASPLRALARDRARVSLSGAGGVVAEGLLMGVGRDALDVLPLAAGEHPRARRPEDVETVPFSALVMVSGEG